jgi:hypothetical protein
VQTFFGVPFTDSVHMKSVDWAFGKQDSNDDEEPGFETVDFNTFSRGVGPGSFDVNVNLEGNLEVGPI